MISKQNGKQPFLSTIGGPDNDMNNPTCRCEVLSIEWACTNVASGLGLILRPYLEATLFSEQVIEMK